MDINLLFQWISKRFLKTTLGFDWIQLYVDTTYIRAYGVASNMLSKELECMCENRNFHDLY